MRKVAAVVCALLLWSLSAAAAAPDGLWQEYQRHPGYTSTQPLAPAPAPAPRITVEGAEHPVSSPVAAEGEEKEKPAQAEAAPAVTVGNVPVPASPRPQALPSLVKKPPLPRVYMRTPQAGDFTAASAAGYSLLLPKAFGSDPLKELPNAQGAMLVRTAGNALMCAATVLDPADSASFRAAQPLPSYAGKHVCVRWQHGSALLWDCLASRHDDYYGDKLIVEARCRQGGRLYQLLYVMPAEKTGVYLPQALYSLDSFRLEGV